MKIQGNIVDVVHSRIYKGEISIMDGIIHEIKDVAEVPDHFIIPGFIDAHVHVESSMLIPSEFARLAVIHGTVGTVSDPHEIGNVLGKEGVRFMIENGKQTPFKFYFGAPSCVPATKFETAGATIDLADLEEIFSWEDVNYLAEMMNYPGVLNEDAEVMNKIALALRLKKVVDGHAPGMEGPDVLKYANAGISTDHECFTKTEALEKLAAGMKILIREGSAAKNFEALYTLVDEYPDQIMFCSDDKHPNDLIKGHINNLARRAVANGCDVMKVLRACSLTPIQHYGMRAGLLQPGDPADFCIVNNLEEFVVQSTCIDGQEVARNGETHIERVAVKNLNAFDCAPISANQLLLKDIGKAVKVITVEDGQLITKSAIASLSSRNGCLIPDMDKDILKMVVVNRYYNAKPAVCFVKNFGLKQGAIASCVAHDSHNIIAVGTNDEDLTKAINLIIAQKGGISVVSNIKNQILPLPIAGIMTSEDGFSVASAYENMDKMAKDLGSNLESPFMTLSFCALLVIPELKLSDKGLFDANIFSFTEPYSD